MKLTPEPKEASECGIADDARSLLLQLLLDELTVHVEDVEHLALLEEEIDHLEKGSVIDSDRLRYPLLTAAAGAGNVELLLRALFQNFLVFLWSSYETVSICPILP